MYTDVEFAKACASIAEPFGTTPFAKSQPRFGSAQERLDFDAVAYWLLENLALGNKAGYNLTTGANNNGLQKSGGCDGCPDSGGNSQQTLTAGDGYVEITATETTTL